MTLTQLRKEAAKECAEKIVDLTGYGGRLHVNDILPDLKELTARVYAAALDAVESGMPMEKEVESGREIGWNAYRAVISLHLRTLREGITGNEHVK